MPVWTRGNYLPEPRPFDPPYFFRISQCRKWSAAVADDMLGDERLWRTYWKRFNTVEIPILPQDEFFDTALSIAKLAGGRREEFERMFEEKNKQRWGEIKSLLAKIQHHARCHKEVFLCEDAQKKVIRVCETGCLTHFLDILKGSAYGYEADVVRDEPLDDAPNSLDEETQIPEDEYFDKDGSPLSQMPSYDPDICFYEEPSTKDWREPLMADNVFYIGSYTVEYAPPEVNDGGEGAPNPETGRTSSLSPPMSRSASEEKTVQTTTQKKRKRSARKSVRFDDAVDVERDQHQQLLVPDDDNDDNDRAHKRARLDASASHASSPVQPATEESASKKRSRHDDNDNFDDNDDHDDHRGKRQKLETSTAPSPTPHSSSPSQTAATERNFKKRTRHSKSRNQGRKLQSFADPPASPPTPSASSVTTASGSTASRKRSRQDDDPDNGFKRQKLEDPTVHTPQSQASLPPQQTTDERIDSPKEDARENRKRRGSSTRQSRKKPPPPPRPLNTRSRRGGPSTFLELDQSGKPRSV